MIDRYDVDGTCHGDGATALDVRGLLEDASWVGQDSVLDPHEHWASGRRRRNRKRAGAGVLGGVAVVAAAGLVWQAGVFGGELGPQQPHVATVPTGLTTFVLAAPDAPDVDPGTINALRVPTEQELNGTSWTVVDQMWGTDRTAPDVVGSPAETIFSFGDPAADRGWGFTADECGGGWFQDGLSLSADGAFEAGGNLATDDQGCLEPAQTAEDFWLDVLPSGGSLHLLGGHWLLLSVDTGQVGVEQPPPVVVEDAARLVFVRPGTETGEIDLTGPERVPSNEDLAGSRWELLDAPAGAEGAAVLDPWLDDPSELQLWFGEGFPGSLELVYQDGCLLAALRTEGVDGRGVTVPVEGLSPPAEPGPDSCAGAPGAGPALAGSLGDGAQVTLIGDDVLLLRFTLPVGDGGVQTQVPTAPETDGDQGPGEEPAPAPTAAPAPTTPPVPTTPTAPQVPVTPVTPVTPTTPTGAPTPAPQPPTSDPAGTPGTAPSPPAGPTTTPTTTPAAPSSGPGPGEILAGFSAPGTVLTSEGWPGAGGDLFAPTVRAGVNDGFDRVVLDLTGSGTPTWLARYTDAPVRDGSGLPMGIAGDSVLALVVTGMAYPEPGDPVYDGGDFGLDTHRLGAVVEVIRTTPFEGQLQLFVGMQGEERPYRVFLLQNPLRLVVDVQVSP